jgi:hypothetical protein
LSIQSNQNATALGNGAPGYRWAQKSTNSTTWRRTFPSAETAVFDVGRKPRRKVKDVRIPSMVYIPEV